MIKAANLLSMIQINSLGEDIFNQFLGLNEIGFKKRGFKKRGFKKREIQSIRYLTDKLNNNAIHRITINSYDNFYVGYQIPQIGKEFDLLKFGTNYNINIELKSQINEDRIRKQLVKNKFYLNLLEQTVYYIAFAYDEENNDFRFYQLDEQDNLILTSAENVAELLVNQEVNNDILPDNLFSPSNYLVSPFNSTDRFLNKEYFLTQNQNAIKNNIINIVNQHTNTAPDFISLTGSAGTGKTLLTYDIAHHLMQNGKEVLIAHCGQLNDGHEYLTNQGWKIIPIKPIQSYLENANFDVLILDEAQRIRPDQFNNIIEKIRNLNKICIFSFDGKQTLSRTEIRRNMQQQIGAITGIQPFTLTDRIRTNKEIADFIKGLFNSTRNNLVIGNTGNIEIIYFSTVENAVDYIQSIDNTEWKVIEFTNSQYKYEFHNQYSIMQNNNSHRVIGQEFDNVVITIDQYFRYDDNGKLIYQTYAHYSAVQMLFQNITRVRRKLKIIIINNPIILQRCLTLLQT